MLNPVSGEDDSPPVVHPHRNADDKGAFREAEALGDVVRDVREGHGLVELRNRHAVEGRIPLEPGMGKRFWRARHGARSVPADMAISVELRCRGPSQSLG